MSKKSKNMISKEEAEKLMEIKGMTQGSELLNLARYVEQKEGKEGIEKLEKKLKELGYSINFNEIKFTQWYPESLNVLAMVVAKDLFGWKDLFDFGYHSPVFSIGVKIFIKFISPSLFLAQVPKLWKKFVDVGKLEAFFSEKEKNCVIVLLKDYKFHPEMCNYYAGYFLRIAELLIKGKNMTIREEKCIFKGDPYHQYVIRWE